MIFSKFNKRVPLCTAEVQGDWAKLVCDVIRGSHFPWRDAKRAKRLQSRGHKGIVQRKKLLQCLIGVFLQIAMDQSKCIFVHNIPFFGNKTAISSKHNRPSGNRFKQCWTSAILMKTSFNSYQM